MIARATVVARCHTFSLFIRLILLKPFLGNTIARE